MYVCVCVYIYMVQMKLWITDVAGHDTLRMNHNAYCQVGVYNTFQPTEETCVYQRKYRAFHNVHLDYKHL
jgi:hypothetical protein